MILSLAESYLCLYLVGYTTRYNENHVDYQKGKTDMATISLDNHVITTINIFTFEPENQQRGLELLVAIATQLRKEIPGFVAAHFHKSVDGTRVVNYAQYSSHEALQMGTTKLMGELAQTPLLIELRAIATPDTREYEVCTILEG